MMGWLWRLLRVVPLAEAEDIYSEKNAMIAHLNRRVRILEGMLHDATRTRQNS